MTLIQYDDDILINKDKVKSFVMKVSQRNY